MKKVFDIATIAAFLIIIFSMLILTVAKKPVKYSPFENRSMTPLPVFTVSGLFEGKYFPGLNACFSDQIWKRDALIEAFTRLNLNVLKKPVVNNVVVQSGLLLPFMDYPNGGYEPSAQIDDMTDKLLFLDEAVSSYGGKFIYIGIPEQYSMMREYYPHWLNNNESKLTSIENGFFSSLNENNIKNINMREEFLKEGEYFRYYSETDHHYNLFGAFLTYRKLMNEINESFGAELPVVSEDEIEFAELPNVFYGSRNRKLYNVYKSDERLHYFTQKEPLPFTRADNGENTEASVFSPPENELVPATYDLYMGGDIAETVIKTDRDELPNALLFGDSFTNALEVFLYNSFNETAALDLRHYDEKTLLEYIDELKPDYVFCLRDDTAYLSPDGNGNIK